MLGLTLGLRLGLTLGLKKPAVLQHAITQDVTKVTLGC